VIGEQHSPARGEQDIPAQDRPARPPVDLGRVIAEQERIFTERQPESARMAGRARHMLAGGVTSSWQITAPQPVWLSHGRGSKVYDVDGNEYVDLHGGYGAALAGHAHPAIVEAVRGQVTRGTHFAQPTEDALTVADELARRFGQPLWRFANSGTEATMDAVHLMRAITGRDLIIKVEGCYHGHHDSVQVSVGPAADEAGPEGKPAQVPSSTGIPGPFIRLTLVAGFNDLDTVARLLDEHPDGIAGMIIEPIMMNAGIIHPEPGYLAALRDLLHAHGALLTFDEVKTGLTAGPSGATGLTGVVPDITCLAKAIGGGIAVAAIGGSEQVMEHVANGDYEMVGTFNGNPLAMAAARAMLCEVATPEAYQRIDRLRARAVEGLELQIARCGLAAHVVSAGAKGCVVFSSQPVRDYRGFLDIDDRCSHAHWLFQHNGGVFLPPWGKIEQWLISVQHDENDIDRFVANFADFAQTIS
jgi:glutamate-1-semialdehyde 2,1-aminomutase